MIQRYRAGTLRRELHVSAKHAANIPRQWICRPAGGALSWRSRVMLHLSPRRLVQNELRRQRVDGHGSWGGLLGHLSRRSLELPTSRGLTPCSVTSEQRSGTLTREQPAECLSTCPGVSGPPCSARLSGRHSGLTVTVECRAPPAVRRLCSSSAGGRPVRDPRPRSGRCRPQPAPAPLISARHITQPLWTLIIFKNRSPPGRRIKP